MKQKTYIAIDLKSFYASVECRERGLDPLDTNLVVADESRTDKTICLAVTPSLKSYGISGRGRLFEVKQRVKEANAGRRHDAPGRKLEGSSYLFSELQSKPELAIDFIIAPPRMAYYMEYSTRIYEVYMKYVAPEDIVVYSIDEVFMDVTDYLNTYKLSPHDLAIRQPGCLLLRCGRHQLDERHCGNQERDRYPPHHGHLQAGSPGREGHHRRHRHRQGQHRELVSLLDHQPPAPIPLPGQGHRPGVALFPSHRPGGQLRQKAHAGMHRRGGLPGVALSHRRPRGADRGAG